MRPRPVLSYAGASTKAGDQRRWSRIALWAFVSAFVTPVVEVLAGLLALRSPSPRHFLKWDYSEVAVVVFILFPVGGAILSFHAVGHLADHRPRIRGWAPALAAVVLHTAWSAAGLATLLWAFW